MVITFLKRQHVSTLITQQPKTVPSLSYKESESGRRHACPRQPWSQNKGFWNKRMTQLQLHRSSFRPGRRMEMAWLTLLYFTGVGDPCGLSNSNQPIGPSRAPVRPGFGGGGGRENGTVLQCFRSFLLERPQKVVLGIYSFCLSRWPMAPMRLNMDNPPPQNAGGGHQEVCHEMSSCSSLSVCHRSPGGGGAVESLNWCLVETRRAKQTEAQT